MAPKTVPLTKKLHYPLKNIGLNTRSKFKQQIFPFHLSKVSLVVYRTQDPYALSGCKLRGYIIWHTQRYLIWSVAFYRLLVKKSAHTIFTFYYFSPCNHNFLPHFLLPKPCILCQQNIL